MAKASKSTITLGGLEVTNSKELDRRVALLLWGPAGCGKTTFAATAPDDKLWLSVGDNEYVSVSHRDDVFNLPLYEHDTARLFREMQDADNPLGLDKYLAENPNIGTVVLDNVTALTHRALLKAVSDGIGGGPRFKPTMEAPGISAYGGRNAIVLECVSGLLRVTAKHGVHCIIIAHEDDPTTIKNDKGDDIIDFIGIQLGGKLVNNMAWRLSEIWYMSQASTGKQGRRIAIRPTRKRRPMKTRMFNDKGGSEFDLNYDAEKADKGQMTIASWFDEWNKRDGKKLAVPV